MGGPSAGTARSGARATHRRCWYQGNLQPLGLSRGTVRRFARAGTVEELLTRNGTGRRPSLLEEFKPYLHQRWNAGCTNAAVLFAEITARGYRGGQSLVRHYLHQFRTKVHIPRPPRTPPSVRQAVCWIMTDPAKIDSVDQAKLDAFLATSPQLTELVAHVRAFATMMCSLRGQDLEAWMTAVDADEQPELPSFVRGLRRDQDAVTAGLTLHWNSGIVEGHVNRLKMLKRQMFGRAKPDLLRKRVLLTE
ncbi:transposase [Lentzea alba]|uniref:transposase n=1 Tax=Lentzea alba TaxID=2714351 RepID=UPI0039BF4CD6